MQLIPFRIDAERYNVFVVLEDDNVKRIKGHDPAQFDVTKLPAEWHALKLNIVLIGYANEHELANVRRMIARGQAAAALEYLSRGFAYRPDQGDNDAPYGRGH
jgi:hypothetical protein